MAKINRVTIWDMDGTIVCSLHRYKTMTRDGREVIDLQYWRDNEPMAINDSLLPMATQYKADLADPNCYTIIATARVLNDPDMMFIAEKLGIPDYIISRKGNEDSRSGGLLKVNGLQKFANLPQFQNAEWTFYEDNTAYLKAVCDHFAFQGVNIKGVYIPSKQGH